MNKDEIIYSLNKIIGEEITALDELLKLMEEQHLYVVKNDVFNMESIVEKIKLCNKTVASLELKRRAITKDFTQEKTLPQFLEELDNEELSSNFKKIKAILEELRLQKDTNEMLLKQGIGFVNNMLILLNPDRQAKTYNGYGKIGR
ncbi:FlgN protein [Clostridium homopropionicum DSM 5847]|uniref:FlgN protein n=1 Tax=Clostridium homopropionicum DSM 5847 TaxID=1121318 RepID=A0A0L6ZDM2_9CLOT|nr:flagellar protein FlgN [Clostridium homopropionicum]KOA21052.1 FlgN protein [Clostridium homopropionicum DSM 5847]SFF98453.1 Flagellar biosynthesis/type III secretory pathway chaperone [Clostridium homopropionicum]